MEDEDLLVKVDKEFKIKGAHHKGFFEGSISMRRNI